VRVRGGARCGKERGTEKSQGLCTLTQSERVRERRETVSDGPGIGDELP